MRRKPSRQERPDAHPLSPRLCILLEGPPSKLCKDAGGCNDLTCCEATCETYKHCETPRYVLDPHKQHDAARHCICFEVWALV